MSSDLYKQLTAPNGVTYNQPLVLFINNEMAVIKSRGIYICCEFDVSLIVGHS